MLISEEGSTETIVPESLMVVAEDTLWILITVLHTLLRKSPFISLDC